MNLGVTHKSIVTIFHQLMIRLMCNKVYFQQSCTYPDVELQPCENIEDFLCHLASPNLSNPRSWARVKLQLTRLLINWSLTKQGNLTILNALHVECECRCVSLDQCMCVFVCMGEMNERYKIQRPPTCQIPASLLTKILSKSCACTVEDSLHHTTSSISVML